MSERTVTIVQARMGSTRLPGKVLKDIQGRTMLERVLSRLEPARRLDEIVVATSTLDRDDAIEELCNTIDYHVVRGSEQDVLDRYHDAAVKHDADVIVRVTSDCPLIDPEIIDDLVERYKEDPSVDYVSNILEPRTFPRGLDAEVVSMEALDRAWKEDDDPATREHVTPYIKREDRFERGHVTHEPDLSHHRWTVDEPRDLKFVREVYARLPSEDAPWTAVLELLEANPEIQAINEDVKQKHGP